MLRLVVTYNKLMKYAASAQRVKSIDKRATEDWGISSAVLMENAGRSAAEIIKRQLQPLPERGLVVAGRGNNGGDGLVVARRLIDEGIQIRVFILGEKNQLKPNTLRNAEILEKMVDRVNYCEPSDDRLEKQLSTNPPLIVDSVFGIGIEGELRGEYPRLISKMNDSTGKKVAIDIPSGLAAGSGSPPGEALRADLTITMGLFKLGALLPGAKEYLGEQHLASVGYPKKLIEQESGIWEMMDDPSARKLLPHRDSWEHKGDFGRLLVVGGSTGMSGAPILSAKSALRCGTGLVHLAGPRSLEKVFSHAAVEPLTVPLPEKKGAISLQSREALYRAVRGKDGLALGPGIGRGEETKQAVRSFIDNSSIPTVVDADGVIAFSDALDVLHRRENLILTPHPGELAHLVGSTPEKVNQQRYRIAPKLAEDLEVVLLLKGVPTVIASPEGDSALANCPNSGLAKGGSGDVLTGIIGSFLAQGLSPFSAACLGSWLHCQVGSIGVQIHGEDSLLPGDMVDLVGSVLKNWRRSQEV